MHKEKEKEFLKLLDKVQDVLVAFTVRDIQVTNTILTWLDLNGISVEQYRLCVDSWIELSKLKSLGYFTPTEDVERAKITRRIEREIKDPVLRHYARRIRLYTTRFTPKGG